jgi:3-dehydroquinate synthetase
MLDAGVQRGDLLVAVGGGVVGDLAGFAAATVLRGIGLLHVPTTLLSMVDSSVGGKTAINHRTGKNLIGAFHQAQSVLIDSSLLSTLPDRECRSGWGEIIKHAVIEASTPGGVPPKLLNILERNHGSLISLEEPLVSWVIARNIAIKAAVVAADEREAGIRAFLNFGHTIGHGIEAAGYSLLHGEAVAVGMSAAFKIAELMDLVDPGGGTRIRNLIEAFGLPLVADVDPRDVLEKMLSDKKKSSGRQTWVLPHRDGRVRLHNDVPEAVVLQAVQFVTCAN